MLTHQEFTGTMFNIYRRTKDESDYNATRFLQMLTEHNGLEAVRFLIHTEEISDGYIALCGRRRLNFTFVYK